MIQKLLQKLVSNQQIQDNSLVLMHHLYSDSKNLRLPNTKAIAHKQPEDGGQFHLYVLAVHLSVKFPCQMTLEYKQQILKGTLTTNSLNERTLQSKPKSSLLDQQKKKFIINNELCLERNPSGGVYEITVNLATGKGANYFAGVVKINQKLFFEAQGQILGFALQKCLDPDALCEVMLNKKSQESKSQISPSRQNSNEVIKTQLELPMSSPTNIQKADVKIFPQFSETQSFLKVDGQTDKKIRLQNVVKQRFYTKAQNGNRSAREKLNPIKVSMGQLTENSKSSSSLREGFGLLKKSQTIVDIPSSNWKNDSSNRNLRQNTLKIKEMEMEIQALMKSKVEKGPMELIIKEKNDIIKNLQQTIKSLQDNKIQLESNLRQQQQYYEQKNIGLTGTSSSKSVIQKNKKITYLESSVIALQSKVDNLYQKNIQLEKLQKLKTIDSERVMQHQKNNTNNIIDKLNEKVRDLNISKREMDESFKNLNEDYIKSKRVINDLERENESLSKEIKDLHNELEQLKIYKTVSSKIESKSEYVQSELDNKTQMYTVSRKQSQGGVSEQICQNCRRVEELLEMQHSSNVELQEQYRNFKLKTLQLSKSLSILQIQEQRARKEVQSCRKQIEDYKTRQKSLSTDLRDSEQRIISLQNKLQVQTQKYQLKQMKERSLKQETHDSKSSATKMREAYEELQMSHIALMKERDNISFQCQKSKMKMKALEEKVESVSCEGKEKQSYAMDKLSKAEKEIIGLRSKVNSMISSNQDLNDQVHAKQLKNLKFEMDLENYQRQVRQAQDKLNRSSGYSKEKQIEVYQLISSNKEKELKIDHLKQELNASKIKYTELLSESNNSNKTSQLLQIQISNLKLELQQKTVILDQVKKSQESIRYKLEIVQAERQNSESKVDFVSKEFEGYKQSVRQIISLVPIVSKKDYSREIDLENSRRSAIDDLDQSFIYQLPITYFNYRELGENSSLSDMKEIIIQYCQQSCKNTTTLTEHNRHLELQNQKINRELANVTESAYKSEQSLFAKMKHFSDEIQEMAAKYTQQIKGYDEVSKKLKKQLSKKQFDNDQLNKQVQSLRSSLQYSKTTHQSILQSLTKKYERQLRDLQQQNEQLQTSNDFITLKNNSLLQASTDLQKELQETRKTLQQTKTELIAITQRKTKENAIMNEQLKSTKSQLEIYKANKVQSLRKINELQTDNGRLKEILARNKDVIGEGQKIIQQIRGRLEETTRQRDLKSKGEFEKESRIVSLMQEISSLQNQNIHHKETIDIHENKIAELKESIRLITLALKDSEDKAKLNEKKKEDVSDRALMYQRKMQQNDQRIDKLEKKNLLQMQQFAKVKNEFLSVIQQENQNYSRVLSDKNMELIDFERRVQSALSESKKNQDRNNELQEMIYAERHKILELQHQNEICNKQKEELQDREQELQGMYCDLTEETKQREEKMFGLSSKVHELQNKLKQTQKQHIEALQQSTARWEIKLKRLTEQYNNRINTMQRSTNQISMIIPKTHQLQKQGSQVNMLRMQPERDRDVSPVHKIESDERQEEKYQSGILHRSKKTYEEGKELSHQYSHTRHLRYQEHEDMHSIHVSSYTTRNALSRKEIKKYEPIYRRSQRYL